MTRRTVCSSPRWARGPVVWPRMRSYSASCSYAHSSFTTAMMQHSPDALPAGRPCGSIALASPSAVSGSGRVPRSRDRLRAPIRSGSLPGIRMPCRERAVELTGGDPQATVNRVLFPAFRDGSRHRPSVVQSAIKSRQISAAHRPNGHGAAPKDSTTMSKAAMKYLIRHHEMLASIEARKQP